MKLIRILYFVFFVLMILAFAYIFTYGRGAGANQRGDDLIAASITSSVSLIGVLITSLIIVIGTFKKSKKDKDPNILD